MRWREGVLKGVEFVGKTVKNMYSINTKRSCLKYINIQLKTNIIHFLKITISILFCCSVLSRDFKCINIKDFTKLNLRSSADEDSSLKESKIQDGWFLPNSRPSKTWVLTSALLGTKQTKRPGFSRV